MIGLAACISSTEVLKCFARTGSVSPVWAIYETNSPGEYWGRAGRGVYSGNICGVLVASKAICVPATLFPIQPISIKGIIIKGNIFLGFIIYDLYGSLISLMICV